MLKKHIFSWEKISLEVKNKIKEVSDIYIVDDYLSFWTIVDNDVDKHTRIF